MAIHYLDMEDEFDCDLLGIACHLNNYRMCWLINTALQSNLKRSEKPLQVWHSEDLSSQHTYYSGENTYWKSTLNLVQNKSKENRYLVPEKKVADYILIIRNPKEIYTKEVLSSLNKQSLILTAFRINILDLKSRSNLIF